MSAGNGSRGERGFEEIAQERFCLEAWREMEAMRDEPETPLEAFMRRDGSLGDDGAEASEAEWEIMRRTVRKMMQFLLGDAEEVDQPAMMKRLFVMGRALAIPAFLRLTMGEEALLFGQGKAAVSFRNKLFSGQLKLAGLRGYKLPGQKRETPRYAEAQRGNRNRAKKKAARKRIFTRPIKAHSNEL